MQKTITAQCETSLRSIYHSSQKIIIVWGIRQDNTGQGRTGEKKNLKKLHPYFYGFFKNWPSTVAFSPILFRTYVIRKEKAKRWSWGTKKWSISRIIDQA